MRFNFRTALISVAVAFAAASCAKQEDVDLDKIEKQSLDAWVSKYVNNEGVVAVKMDNGMYVTVDNSAADAASIATTDTIVWIKYDCTAHDLYNNVYLTRDENTARRQGSYTPYTHYVPAYIYCGQVNSGMIDGLFYAFRNKLKDVNGNEVSLRKGSRVKLYLPSSLAYGSLGVSDEVGYGGQYSLDGSIPSVMNISIEEVIKDPVAFEKAEVDEFVAKSAENYELVVDSLKYLYVDRKFRLAEGKVYDGDSIKKDSTVKVWYVGKFIDGFVFDTNIDSVKTRLYGKVDSKGEALGVTVNDEGGVVKGWLYSLQHLRKGQWAKMVFVSEYGYGIDGRMATNSSSSSTTTTYYNPYLYSNAMSYMYNTGYMYGMYDYGYSDYYNYYYNDYYNSLYSSTTDDSDYVSTITTEIQSYTPLVFEVYIEE